MTNGRKVSFGENLVGTDRTRAIREEAQLEVYYGPTVGGGDAARFHSQTPIALADLVICPFPDTMPQTELDESKPWRRQSQRPAIAVQDPRRVPATH
jgi:hypothetical protein